MRFVPVVKVDEDKLLPAPGTKLVVGIEINGTCVVIDNGVDEQVLRTVFSALRGLA